MSSLAFGRYEIRRELGRGAMGTVYEAHDPARGIDVALKVMTVPAGATPEARRRKMERFAQEARALSRLAHPNVVRVFDQGELSGRHYFSMELVRGTTLRDRLQFQGALSLPELVRLAIELCDALAHVHREGVVHRDLKPENIMLLPDGAAKLMDFGVAQVLADGASAGGFHGSPAYMSPEQVTGRVVDARSDLYSLALTLSEAATGRRVVEGESIPEITQKVLREQPPPPPGLPPYLRAILARALAKDPDRRYPDAGEMAADLRAGRPPRPAAPVSPPESPVPAWTPPPAAYLGAAAEVAPAPAPAAAEVWSDGGMALWGEAAPAAPPQPAARPAGRPGCRLHPAFPGVETCSRCGHPLCYTCLVELPGRGVLCRPCAFAPPEAAG